MEVPEMVFYRRSCQRFEPFNTQNPTEEAYATTANPGGGDAGTGGENVESSTIVGEGGAAVSRVGRTDSADTGLRGGRGVGGITVVVASGDGDKDARGLQARGGLVDGGRVATAEGHAGDDALGAVARGAVGGDKVHAGNDAAERAGAAVLEHLDAKDGHLLGHAPGLGADGAGAVRAVAVAVAGAADKGLDLLGTAFKLLYLETRSGKLYPSGQANDLQGGCLRHQCQ